MTTATRKRRSDPKLVISASAEATKAYKYIMGTETKEEDSND